ncbi:MAG: hypothetical protein ACRDPJ_21970 [Nocardioidaceae bacterium]
MNLENWLRRFFSQDRAVENARAASTELARRRVEHQEAEIFLQECADRRQRSA